MEKKQTNISTIPVTIKVIEVGNKKMTISVFNQIPQSDFFYENSKDNFLGWVNYKDSQYILFTKNGVLVKDIVYEISRLTVYEYEEQKRRYFGRTPDEDDYKYSAAISEYERQKSYIERRYKNLLDNKNQIYIAI